MKLNCGLLVWQKLKDIFSQIISSLCKEHNNRSEAKQLIQQSESHMLDMDCLAIVSPSQTWKGITYNIMVFPDFLPSVFPIFGKFFFAVKGALCPPTPSGYATGKALALMTGGAA